MAGLVNELIDILNNQSGVYEQLLELSVKKKDIIVKNDVDALKSVTASENTLIGRSQRLEKKRMETASDIANVLNVKGDNVTLSYLCKLLKNQNEHAALEEAANRLRRVLDSLKAANDANKILIENSLDYIQFNINVLKTTYTNEPSIYSATGDEIYTGKNVLDIKN